MVLDANVESPIKYIHEKKEMIISIDKFEICTIDKQKIRKTLLKDSIIYAHHDGKKLDITIVNPDGSMIKY